jgi:mRNA interferase MazF
VRPIHVAHLDTARPVLVLTREPVRLYMARVTVAPITITIRGLSSEVRVGRANGLDNEGVVSCDNIVTVPKSAVGRRIGYLLPSQESALSLAIRSAFDLV